MKNVYLIVCEENQIYKIGTTLNPLRLVKKLQTENPEKLRLVHVFPSRFAEEIERALHRNYAHCRKSGE